MNRTAYNYWKTSTYFLMLLISFFCGWSGNMEPMNFSPSLSLKAALALTVILFLVQVPSIVDSWLNRGKKND